MKPPSVSPPRFRPERLPLWLLLLALSTVFLCSFDEGHLYRHINDNWNTARNLAIAENLAPDHNFRLFLGRDVGPGGAPAYDMYSRFPVGGYALIRLAILPSGNDLSARILAARMLMLLLFAAAALLAFHSLLRITSQPWVALAATLTAFSSYYMLFYANEVSNEFSMDLFAVMLVFHGMVAFVQEGRFRQLLARTGVALLLGWRVYAFLLPFLILGLAYEAVRAWKDGTAPWPRVRSAAGAVLRSRYLALGVFALLFGAAVLGFNFANEYAALGGETRVAELPSVQSMLWRTGLTYAVPVDPVWWLRFLQQQFFRVCMASVPFVLTDRGLDLLEWFPSLDSLARDPFSGWGVSVSLLALAAAASTTAVCLARRLLARPHRMLLAALALSGFFWALPMRHQVYEATHRHEALFYVGVPLVFYSLLLLYVHKRWGPRPVAGLAVAALLAFVVSTFHMDRLWRPDARATEVQQAAMAELGTLRETTREKAVLLLPSVRPEWFWQITGSNPYVRLHHYVWQYFLAGSVRTHFRDMEVAARAADFILTRDRVESDALLTPGNEQVFLYGPAGMDDLAEFYRATRQRVVSGDPAAQCRFDVHLEDGVLFHVKDPCVPKDVQYPFFVTVVPEDSENLPRRSRPHGYKHRLPITFQHYAFFEHTGVLLDGKCMTIIPLPDHPISRIRTGQEEYLKHPHDPHVSKRLQTLYPGKNGGISEGERLPIPPCRKRRQGWEVEIPASR